MKNMIERMIALKKLTTTRRYIYDSPKIVELAIEMDVEVKKELSGKDVVGTAPSDISGSPNVRLPVPAV